MHWDVHPVFGPRSTQVTLCFDSLAHLSTTSAFSGEDRAGKLHRCFPAPLWGPKKPAGDCLSLDMPRHRFFSGEAASSWPREILVGRPGNWGMGVFCYQLSILSEGSPILDLRPVSVLEGGGRTQGPFLVILATLSLSFPFNSSFLLEFFLNLIWEEKFKNREMTLTLQQ